MIKEELIKLLKRILERDVDLNFLLKLEPEELETLVACIRDRMDREKK